MELDLTLIPQLLWISFGMTLIPCGFWLTRLYKKRKASMPATADKFTAGQILGMVGIVCFLAPILLWVSLNLARGVLLLFLFTLQLVQLPDQWVTTIISILYGILFAMALVLALLVVRYLWPKRRAASP